ncbi:MAG: hypothetical protein ACR2PT_07740 [Endozoicomonas sp.]
MNNTTINQTTEFNSLQPTIRPQDIAPLPRKTVEAPTVMVSTPATASGTTGSPLADRNTSLTKEELNNRVKLAFEQLAVEDLDPEVIALMNLNGTVGLLLKEQPSAGLPLVKARLNDLKADIERWWGVISRKPEARAAIKDIEVLLAIGNYDEALNALSTYEKAHGKPSFTKAVDEQFINQINPRPEFPFTYGTQNEVVHELHTNTAEEESFDKIAGEIMVPENWAGSRALDAVCLQAPKAITYLIFEKCNNDMQLLRGRMKAGEYCDPAEVQLLSKRLKDSVSLTTQVQINNFVDAPEHTDLKTYLGDAARRHLFKLRFRQIKACDLSKMDNADLDRLKSDIDGLLAMKKLIGSASEPFQEMTSTLETAKKACDLARFMNAEQELAASERVYSLKTPDMAQLIATLESVDNTAANELYKNIENYLAAADAFAQLQTHESMVRFQQERFKLRMCQESLVMAETRAIIAGKEDASVFTPGTYEQNIQLLALIDGALQATTPVQPALSQAGAMIKIFGQHFWNSRTTLDQKMAELQKCKDLAACGYYFWTELSQLVSDVSGNSDAVKTAIGNIAAPAKDGIAALLNGGSLWKTVMGLGGSVSALEEEARKILTPMLEVAERDPVMFRRMMGDFGQTCELLKSLVGASGLPLLEQLKTRLSMESGASCFAGDEAKIRNFDPEKEPELARNIRRFQLICDLARYGMHLSVGANIAKNVGSTAALIAAGLGGPAAWIMTGAAAVKTAASTAGAYTIRESVNAMPGDTVRSLDKLVNFGPSFLVSTSATDELATIARGVAKGETFCSTAVNWLVAPFKFRLNKLTEAFYAVREGKENAWMKLAIEGAKSGLVLAAGVGAYATGVAALALPVVPAQVAAIASMVMASRTFCNYLNSYEKGEGIVLDTIADYRNLLLSEDSAAARAVNARCRQEADELVKRMSSKHSFKQYAAEKAVRGLKIAHWTQFEQDNPAKAADFKAGARKNLAETETARRELAKELTAQARALAVLEKYKAMGTEVEARSAFARFKSEMQGAGVPVSHINRLGVAYYIHDKISEITHSFDRMCGTETPGTTEEAIYRTLTQYHLDIELGGYLPTLLKLSRSDVEAARKVSAKKLADSQRHRTEAAIKERTQLALEATLKGIEEEKGKKLTREELDSEEFRRLMSIKLKGEVSKLEDMTELKAAQFRQALAENELYRQMTPDQRKYLLGETMMTENQVNEAQASATAAAAA